MIINNSKNIVIDGIACAVPSKYNSMESQKQGDNDAAINRFIKNTSVLGHYEVSKRQTASDLCFAAANKILTNKKIDKSKIGVLVFVTQNPDYIVPSTACVLQSRLGLSKDCVAFDVNLGCSGFVYGLNIVSSLMQNSNIEYGLLLAGDSSSKGVRTDNSKNLFGDAGSAALLKKSESEKEMSFASRTDGSGFKALLRPYGAYRHRNRQDVEGVYDEIGVFNFAISEAPKLINEFLESRNETSENYDSLGLHQANMMIMKQITKRTKFSKEKMLLSIDKYANTSAASIPLAIVEGYAKETDSKDIHCLICGYGVGLSWSAGAIWFNTSNVYPIETTDEYFDDGLYE